MGRWSCTRLGQRPQAMGSEIKKMLKHIYRWADARWSATATGLAAYSALGLFLWPPKEFSGFTSIDVGLLLAAVTTFSAWLFSELRRARPRLSEHDAKLYELIRSEITDIHLEFLRDFDFGSGPFHERKFNDFARIVATWKGARYQFYDPGLRQSWASVCEQMRRFVYDGGVHLHSVGPKLDHLSMERTDRYSSEETERRFFAERDTLNNLASELYRSFDKFEEKVLPLLESTPD